ncbi:rho GTPase-activating protein 190 isoform X7 [Drosophila willistoni]|uniref:rho GTPase-activating protein 190 isoform X7 n=1 Tax=Drosophila willistoni TaxID=7260 RepID=UPI000C26C4A7|nr:rho GTPase-activating protein 190 isoform X7 [Drosophila willistoni]
MRQFNISVIGLSGTEKDRGQVGVGKSCLCNRFMRPMADDYFIDHISVLSQSDFSGRIVNNDHFLYWGEVRKTTEEGVEYNFNIIEQTEFMDDSTFQAFKVGKMDPYLKRCTSTKVFSAEKLMYICKNQLGIEKEYEQKVMPDGRLSIDGFVVVFDVSPVPNRSVEKQVEFVQNVIATIIKNKKPLVLVTTKNDDAYELYVREAEKISQRKDYKSTVQLIETSAHESINIDLAFLMLAQMIDKVKNRVKIISYQESAKSRKELLDTRSEAVTRLIRNQITDYHILWSQGSKMLSQYREWNEFLNIFGNEAGQKLFRRHMKKLRDDHLNKKLHQYLDKFALALEYMLPDISALNISDDDAWECARNYLQNHIEFEQYFFECPQASWTELIDMDEAEDETRIPFDVLETSESETVFRNYLNSVQQDKKKIGWKQQFKMLLEESGFVTPGKQLSEVRVLFMGRECFEALSEHDCQQIYDIHQDEIIEKSKQNFVELLLEHAQYFLQFKNVDIITQEDVRQITDVIQEDSRYKMLDRLDQERRVILLQHLRFIHCPIREHCPFFNNCVDSLIEEVLSDKSASNHKSQGGGWKTTGNGSDRTLNLLIVGSEHLASDLLNDIRICTGSKGEYIYENQTYYLNYRIANGDMEAFKAIDVSSSGLICVYSNQQSFETLKDNLERTLLCNLELEDKFENLPIVLVYQPQDLKENEVEYLRSEGMRLSEMLHCDFIDHTQNHQKYVYDILNIVILSLKLTEMKSYEPYPSNHTDLRILCCIFCGDQYDIENIVQPLVAESMMVKANEHSIIIDVFIGDAKRRVEFILSSYHGTNQYRDELIHGYIYFYSAKRRSSLANLSILAAQNANIPLQIIAVTESGGVNAFFNSDICQFLITEGNALADRFKGSFMTFSADQYVKFAFYNPFLKTAWDNKYEVENLHVEESITLDSGEGTLENSVNQMPRPPPRHESYMLSNTLGTDGSGSENYEMLPTRSLNSLNEERDISLDEIYDDNNEKPKHLHQNCTESDSCASSTERRVRQQNAYYKANKKAATTKKNKKKKVAIPVQTPRVPPFGSYVSPPEIPLHYQRMAGAGGVGVNVIGGPIGAGEKKKSEAGVSEFMKSDKSPEYSMVPELANAGIFGAENLPEFNMNAKCLKDFEKLEKRRIKEETARLRKLQEKEKEQEKKLKRKLKQQNAKGITETTEAQFGKLMICSEKDDNIPIFLIKCVEFIEKEGLDSEGIYRVPGSRAHVDMLFQRFEEDPNTVIDVLDIPVNAVATALKDFFSKRLPPLFSKDIIKELEEIAGSRGVGSSKLNVEVKTDRSCRLIALKSLLQKLPPINFAILKYIFQHFVHVSDNSKLNSMDSKNLAICWWPTLIPIDFTDMGHFEQLRPYLEDIVQTMIDQFPYLFCGKDAFVMV